MAPPRSKKKKKVAKERYSLVIDPDLLEKLRAITKERGIPSSEQIRRGIVMYLQSEGVKV